MKRLLTAAIAVTAIATFVSPEARYLSQNRREMYVSAVQYNLVCTAQKRHRHRLSTFALPEWCPLPSR